MKFYQIVEVFRVNHLDCLCSRQREHLPNNNCTRTAELTQSLKAESAILNGSFFYLFPTERRDTRRTTKADQASASGETGGTQTTQRRNAVPGRVEQPVTSTHTSSRQADEKTCEVRGQPRQTEEEPHQQAAKRRHNEAFQGSIPARNSPVVGHKDNNRMRKRPRLTTANNHAKDTTTPQT